MQVAELQDGHAVPRGRQSRYVQRQRCEFDLEKVIASQAGKLAIFSVADRAVTEFLFDIDDRGAFIKYNGGPSTKQPPDGDGRERDGADHDTQPSVGNR